MPIKWSQNMKIAVSTVSIGVLACVGAFAEDDVFYQSSLADESAVKSPLVGPAAIPGTDGAPIFAEASGKRGIISRGSGNQAVGSYRIPLAEWPAVQGTISCWLTLPPEWKLPQQAMPIVMGQENKLALSFDLRQDSQTLNCMLGKTEMNCSIADWKAGEIHHIAINWNEQSKRVNYFIDGVRVARGPYEPVTLTEFYLNGWGRAQANYAAIVSDLQISRKARAEFPEVPEVLRAAQRAKLTPQAFAAAKAEGLPLTAWKAEPDDAAEILSVGGGVLAVRIDSIPKEGVILHPAEPIVLKPTTLRFLADVNVGRTSADTKIVFLVKGDDGKEREIPSRQIKGSCWSQVVSDYVGGERVELNSMRPDFPHPRGEALPVALTGIKLIPQRGGLVYLRNIEPSEIEYLKHRRWEMVPPFGEMIPPTASGPFNRGMHPFGPAQPEVRLDWFLPDKAGTYKVQWSLTDVFQGPDIGSGEWMGDWNPANLADAYKKRFSFNLPGAGTYWLTLKTWDGTGALVNLINLPMGVVRDKEHTPARPDWSTFPRLIDKTGILRIDTGVENHVFPNPESAKLRVRVADPEQAKKSYVIRLSVKDTSLMKRLEKPAVSEHPWKSTGGSDMDLPLALKEVGAAYDLVVELLSDSKVMDRAKLRVGVRDGFKPIKPMIVQPTLATLFGSGKVVVTNGDSIGWYATGNAKTDLPFEEYYKKNIESWKRYGVTVERVDFPLEEVLPLPGFVDARSTQMRFRLLREAGLPYMIAFSAPHFQYDPAWLPFRQQEDISGIQYIGLDEWANAYFMSPASQAEVVQPLVKALYERFGDDPSFLGWVYWTDILFVDHGERRTDFSPPMQNGFVKWLKEQKGITALSDLNARYGTNLASWDEVDMPLPPAERMKGYTAAAGRLDNQAWRDSWTYRMWVIKHLDNDSMARYSRQLGDTRPWGFYSYSYGQDEEEYLADLISLGCFTTLGTEGSPSYGFIRNKTLMPYHAGHAYLAEYQAFLPGFKEMEEKDCDRILATVMLSGGNNLNIAMFLNGPFSQIAPGAHKAPIVVKGLERQTKWITALKEYAHSDIFTWEIGVYSYGESAGGAIAQSLWPAHPNHVLKVFMSDAAFNAQKIIFIPAISGGANDADFTPEMREKALRYVMGGGKLVLVSPDSARYTRDNRAEQFALLTELGWKDRPVLLPEKKGVLNAKPVDGGLFKTKGCLKLAGPVPERVHLPEGAVLEARFDNGQPAVVRWPAGKGEVLLFLRELDFAKQDGKAFVEDLLAWAGVTRRVTAPGFFCYAHDGDVRYLMIYLEGKPKTQETGTVRIHDLPDGQYAVHNIGPDPLDLGIKTGAEWRAGVQVPLIQGMIVLQFRPVNKKGKD
ncbi:MAG: hypothetical protein WAX69_15150 [Victivallales bacterium]